MKWVYPGDTLKPLTTQEHIEWREWGEARAKVQAPLPTVRGDEVAGNFAALPQTDLSKLVRVP